MIKLLLTVTAAMLLSVSVVQSQTATGATASKKTQPTAETTALPPNPAAVTKWFGQAIDDILTSADRTLDDHPGKARRD